MENTETTATQETTQVASAITTLIAFFKNKGTALLVLLVALYGYNKIPEPGLDQPALPYLEIAYTGLTLLVVVVVAPILRLLVFNEAAQYAETGQLDKDLAAGKFAPALVHYWFATAICYAAPIVCMATIAK